MPYQNKVRSYALDVLKMRKKQKLLKDIELIRSNVRIKYLMLEMKEVVLNLLKFEYNLDLVIKEFEVTPEHDIVINDYVLHLCQKQFILYQDALILRNDPESSHPRATEYFKIKR